MLHAIVNFYVLHNLFNVFSCNLEYFLVLANFFFFFGILGIIFNQRNFLLSMLFIEVMYTGIFLYFIFGSFYLNSPIGQVYALTILVSAACESAVGLGILLILFKYDNSISFNDFSELRG